MTGPHEEYIRALEYEVASQSLGHEVPRAHDALLAYELDGLHCRWVHA